MAIPVSSSSVGTLSAVAEGRAADDANLLTQANESRKGCMTAHQVEHTTGADRTIPTVKHKIEYCTKPTKLRRVENIADHCMDRLLAKRATPELMDTEPGISSEIDNVIAISKSTVFHQKELQTHIKYEHLQVVPDNATTTILLKTLEDKNTSDGNKPFLMHVCREFAGSGQPQLETLEHHENILHQYFKEQSTDRSDTDDDLPEASQIKALAHFCCAGPAQLQMAIAEFEQFMSAHRSTHGERTEERNVLQSLLAILVNHGGSGVRFWLEKYHENQQNKQALTEALSIVAPLEQTKFVVAELPVSQWRDYIEHCSNLAPAPDKEQWDALEPLRQQLNRRFKLTVIKRMMLEILWAQSRENRLKYADQMDSLFRIVPSVLQLHQIHNAFGPQKMKDFLDACLASQAAKETVPDVRFQERLLEGLLLANRHLDGHGDIPDFCFARRVSCENGKGVMIDGDTAMPGNERLWHFIAAMLVALEKTEYQLKNQRLTVPLPDKASVVLPLPEFTLTERGFVIKNWSLEQLTVFFKATQFTEQWYQNTQDNRERCTTTLEETLASMTARGKETARTGQKETPPLEPSIILNLINLKLPLNSRVWMSLEHYAKNNQLTVSLCKALDPIILNDREGIVPDEVKNAVTTILGEI